MNLLLEAMVLGASAAAILATVATSVEGPFYRDLKKLGQRLARSSLRLVWSLLSHLVYTLCVDLGSPYTSLTAVSQQLVNHAT